MKVRQSGTRGRTAMGTGGVLVRAVVLSTYAIDDPSHPRSEQSPKAVYCDVLVYSDHPRIRFQKLTGVMVCQERSGLHDGHLWLPRPTSIDISEIPFNADTPGHNPGNLDGDHVLVGFLDDSFSSPIILRSIPHPGFTNGLTKADGDPDFWRHHGSFYGVDTDGSFVVDLTNANTGTYETDGSEPEPPKDGSVGNFKIKLPEESKLTIEVAGGENITLEMQGGDAKLKLGDGAFSAAVAEYLEELYTTAVTGIKDVFDNHIHGTGVGPSAPPTAAVFPNWEPKINSDKVKIPDSE